MTDPWHQIPAMKDGEVTLGEGNAILRYLARQYQPTLYGNGDAIVQAQIDWVLDWASTNLYPYVISPHRTLQHLLVFSDVAKAVRALVNRHPSLELQQLVLEYLVVPLLFLNDQVHPINLGVPVHRQALDAL